MEEPIGSWVFPRLSLTLASKEMVYFSKWIYRHRNRLRKDKSFQRLLQIERLIKRYLKINITSLAKQALKEINSSGRIVSSTQLISFMTQLSDCTLYVIQLLKLMESTFNDLYQRIETCHLLYAYIIVTSSLSRLWFYLKRHVWVLCEIQSRLLADIHKPFDFDLSRIMTKDNVEYLPLSMKSLILPKENKEETENIDLMISPELQALRKRDISSVSSSSIVCEQSQKSTKCSNDDNESQIESKTKKKAKKKMVAKLKRRNERKIKRRELKREQKAIERIRKQVSRRAAVCRFLLCNKKKKIKS